MLFQNSILFFTFYVFSFFFNSNAAPTNESFNAPILDIKHKENANDLGIQKNNISIRAQLILKGEYNVSAALRLHVIWPNVVSTLTQCRRDQILVASVTPGSIIVNFFILKSVLPHAQNINNIYENLNKAILKRDKKFVSLIMKPYNIESAELKKQSVTNALKTKTVSKKKKNAEEHLGHLNRRQEKPHVNLSLKQNKTLTETKQSKKHSNTVVDLNQLNFNSLNSRQPSLLHEPVDLLKKDKHDNSQIKTNLWQQLEERNVTTQGKKSSKKTTEKTLKEFVDPRISPPVNPIHYPLTITVLPLEKNIFEKLSHLQNITFVLPQRNDILQKTSTGSPSTQSTKKHEKLETTTLKSKINPNDHLVKVKEILSIDPRLYNTSAITANDSYIDKTAKLVVNTITKGKPETQSLGTRSENVSLQDSWAPLGVGLASLLYNVPS